MNRIEIIKIEIEKLERERDAAIRLHCERVASDRQRRIDKKYKELLLLEQDGNE